LLVNPACHQNASGCNFEWLALDHVETNSWGRLHYHRDHLVVAAAAVSTPAHPEFASFWVIFGGVLAMGGIALGFAPDRPIRGSYFEEIEVASPEPGKVPATSEFTGETG